MKRSHIISLSALRQTVTDIAREIGSDQVTLYAAQASFFIIISAIPFILLLLSLAKYVIDIDWVVGWVESQISGAMGEFLSSVLREIADKGSIPLISVTAVSTLWSASKGVGAVTRGIWGAYGIHKTENFVLRILRSFFYTLSFVLILLASLIALVFADTIQVFCEGDLPLLLIIFDVIVRCRTVVFTVVLSLFFALLYRTAAKKGRQLAEEGGLSASPRLPEGYGAQLPGAFCAALGWMLFSYVYSLYIQYYPRASYLYGSLAAIVFSMLWLYTCMMILMYGAELNKFLYRHRIARKQKRPARTPRQAPVQEKKPNAAPAVRTGRERTNHPRQ